MSQDATVEMPHLVPFIDGALDGWEERTQHCLKEGHNFFILVREGREAALAELLEQPGSALPAPETVAQLLSSSRFIDQRQFRLPDTKGARERVYHIEQINLPRTHPPNVKQYLLYCYVRGIISQHDLPSDARVACDHYNNDRFARSQFPEAAVYRWENTEWRRTRLC